MAIRIRCRYPSGQCTLKGLDLSMSLQAFQTLLAEKTGVQPNMQEMRVGFPPEEIQLPSGESEACLKMLGIRDGETIVIAEKPRHSGTNPLNALHPQSDKQGEEMVNPLATFTPTAPPLNTWEENDTSNDEDLAKAIAMSLAEEANGGTSNGSHLNNGNVPVEDGPVWSYTLDDGRCVARRYMDSDNSCLFTAIGYVMEHNRLRGLDLRTVISDAVEADPMTYNEAVLGKPMHEYCAWIRSPQNWGGEIELLVLSHYYRRQIAAFDIKTTKCFVYGREEGYPERVMLIYDGLHYDALAVASCEGAPEETDITIFNPNSRDGEMITEGARKLVEQLHSTKQFTDTTNFSLRCQDCGRGFLGERQAMEHAQTSGHTNFSEYK